MATMDLVDSYLKEALRNLHSSAPDSAEKLRKMLDSEIKKVHDDKSKLITNILTKKQLKDEENALGSGFKKQKPKKAEEPKVTAAQPPTESITVNDDEDDDDSSHSSAMDDLMDLTCVTCRNMDSTPNNQLYECVDCHNLHHQLCHEPKITTKESLTSWICSTCKSKKGSKSSRYDSPSSSSSSSSNKKLSINLPVEKKKIDETSSSSSSSKRKSSEKPASSSSSSRSRSSKK